MATITINGVTVDPQAPTLLGAAPFNPAAAPPTNYLLIQPKAPLTAQQRAQLANKGVTILEHVPDGTYLARDGLGKLAEVQALPFIAWVGPYLRGFKVSAALSPAVPQRQSLAVAATGPPQTLSNTPRTVDIVLHRDVDTQAARPKVAAAAGVDPAGLKPGRGKVRLTVTARRLADLAALDEVRHIEEVLPAKLHNDVARRLLGVESPNPGAPPQFAGHGQIVAVADTGFDKGSTSNVHPAFTNRVLRLYALGRAQSNDPDGHGTHVAGSVLADGQSASLGGPIRGTAPQAKLVLQSVLDS